MKPFFSVVIPYHNSAETIGRLLNSLQRSKKAPPYEVVIVDDGSEENLKSQISNLKINSKLPTSHFPLPTSAKHKSVKKTRLQNSVRIVRLDQNKGPAVARNRGVAAARGKFIVFLDSDVQVFTDTLSNLSQVYTGDPDIVAVTGVWVKSQRTKKFFPNFKALRDWSYWINERDKSGYYFLFSTRIASIKRSVFLRLGGFDETYPAPLVEDIELTYRIARRYAIIFAPNVRVRHEFEDFWPIAKKYFLRAYYWTKLYQRRKKFDPVATTWQEAATTVSGVAVVFFGMVSLFLLPTLPAVYSAPCTVESLFRVFSCYYPLFIFYFSLFTLILHVFLIRKFLLFLYQEKGMVFTVKGFFMGLVLYSFIFTGAVAGRIR